MPGRRCHDHPGGRLLGAPDEDRLAYIVAQGRVIFTEDDDFLKLHAAGLPHPGIAYCHQQSRSIGEIIRGLLLVWEIYDPEELANHIEFL